jgi:hypothetical protein
MRSIWRVLKPFVHPDTRDKLVMANGDKKTEVVGQLVDEDQAMPFLLPTGKLSDDVSVERYAREVPFHCSYDNVRNKIDIRVVHISPRRIRGTF